MSEEVDEGRRNFIKFLAAGSGLAAVGLSLGVIVQTLNPPPIGISSFPTLLLVDSSGAPVKASSLALNNPSVLQFSYPLQNTPNFLLNIGNANGIPLSIQPTEVTIPATGGKYQSYGGVGKNNSVVAFSAICQHLGCIFPELRFYPAGVESVTVKGENYTNVIHCLCHGSTYDPVNGGAVITGPTVHPLPSLKLVWDSNTDELYVSNMEGPTIYGRTSDLTGETPLTGSSTVVQNAGNPFQ